MKQRLIVAGIGLPVLVVAAIFVATNLLVDVLVTVIDPRVKLK